MGWLCAPAKAAAVNIGKFAARNSVRTNFPPR